MVALILPITALLAGVALLLLGTAAAPLAPPLRSQPVHQPLQSAGR